MCALFSFHFFFSVRLVHTEQKRRGLRGSLTVAIYQMHATTTTFFIIALSKERKLTFFFAVSCMHLFQFFPVASFKRLKKIHVVIYTRIERTLSFI